MTTQSGSKKHIINLDLMEYYASLSYHRCVLLEGMRLVAFRNINHLFRVSNELNVRYITNDPDLIKIQNQMLTDQHMELSEENRYLLGAATWSSWEIYLCLLYAEIERYQTISKKEGLLVYVPLEQFIKENESTISALEMLRNKIIHPASEVDRQESVLFLAKTINSYDSSIYNSISELQVLIDNYLEWMRTSLGNSFDERISEFSEAEISAWNSYLIIALEEMNALCDDVKIRKNLQSGISALQELQQQATKYVSTPKQDRKFSQFKSWLDLSRISIPKHVDCLQENLIQNPLAASWYAYFFPSNRKKILLNDGRASKVLKKYRAEYLELLQKSIVLLNESDSFLDKEEIRKYSPSEFFKRLKENLFQFKIDKSRLTTGLESENMACGIRIAYALLSEPMRMYKDACRETPSAKVAAIDDSMSDEMVNILREFRNNIFHVSADVEKIIDKDYAAAMKLPRPHESIKRLHEFYISVD